MLTNNSEDGLAAQRLPAHCRLSNYVHPTHVTRTVRELAEGELPPLAAHLVTPWMGFAHHGIHVGDGKVVHYATCTSEASLNGFYENDPSGSPVFRFSSDKSGDRGKPWARAEPSLLGTRFHYLSNGESEWKWKRILTGKMRDHMSSSTIQEVAFEKERLRITTYDSRFNVIGTTFRPTRPATPPL